MIPADLMEAIEAVENADDLSAAQLSATDAGPNALHSDVLADLAEHEVVARHST